MQDLLVPFVFNVNVIEKQLIDTNINIFKEMGFYIEEFGTDSFKIVSIPAVLDGINLQEFIIDSLKRETLSSTSYLQSTMKLTIL